MTETKNIQAYLDPVKTGLLTITVETGEVISYSIFDMFGKLVHINYDGEKTEKVDTRSFGSGIFLVSVTVDGKPFTKRIKL